MQQNKLDEAQPLPDYLGHRTRMKERVLTKGASSLTETDLLETLLMYSIPRRDVKPIAKRLLHQFGTLRNVLAAEQSMLLEVKGIKESTVCLFKLVEGVCFQMLTPISKKATYLDNWPAVLDFARLHLSHKNEEELICLFLNPAKKLIKHEIFDNGTRTNIEVSESKIINSCVSIKACYLILIHNHPSGNIYPSPQDIESTGQLQFKLNALGIKLIDHIIIANNQAYSILNKSLVKEV